MTTARTIARRTATVLQCLPGLATVGWHISHALCHAFGWAHPW